MFPSPSSAVLNRGLGLVESQDTMAAASHISFSFQPSSLPHPRPLPYGSQYFFNNTCSVGERESLQFMPPRPRDGFSDQTGASSLQRASSTIWQWEEEGQLNKKRPFAVGEEHQNNKKINGEDVNIDYLQVNNNNNNNNNNNIRMKKVKRRRRVREPRFCFKTMSEVDVLDDGYKWRKYGQKVVKNTQHPRSYYRCTQENCRVKKRVERLAEDPRMVITSYEGRHAHSPSHDEDESQAASQVNFYW
ncbi:uncharacterized protein [Typha latifolia]|uniref:uncharacterized protein n=1 Tax=Typha latifolia TaxID=4733 RepID=UPI003C2B353B